MRAQEHVKKSVLLFCFVFKENENERETETETDRETDREKIFIFILFTRVIISICAFLHPALAQTRDYSRSNSTCTRVLRYGAPVHTWNKRSLDVKLNMKQAGTGVDRWGFEIIISKHYLVSKCVISGRHNMVQRFRRVTMTKFNMQCQPVSA